MMADVQPQKKPLCDEARLAMLVRAWQRAPAGLKEEWWRAFVNESADWIMAIIRSFKRHLSSLGSHEDIRAEVILHLHNRVLPAYRYGRGRLFSLVTIAAQNYIRTLLERQQRISRHYVTVSESEQEWALSSAPEVYGLATEIRERLDHFTAPDPDDFEFFPVRNLVVYAYGQRGGSRAGVASPTPEQIAQIVAEIVSLPAPLALQKTTLAINQLQKELADFRGRPSLYSGDVIDPPMPVQDFDNQNCRPAKGIRKPSPVSPKTICN
jgi:hypothetical protein